MPNRHHRSHRYIRVSATLAAAFLALLGLLALPAAAQEGDDAPTDDAPTDDAPSGAEGLQGTLRDQDREPVPGVIITVETEDGTHVAEVETAADGTWFVPVPEPGRYSVTIDVDSLPEGAGLQDPDRTTLTPVVREGRNQTVVFAIGERSFTETSRVDRMSNLLAEGVKFGLLIALGALGLSMVYGVTGLVNFAHGELLAFGAIVAFWLERGSGFSPEMPLVLAAVLAALATALFAGAWEIGIFGPVRKRRSGEIAAMVISIGLALVVRHLYLATYGSRRDFFLDYRLQSTVTIGPVSMTPKAWISIVITAVILLAVGWALKNTKIGTAMRAVSVNKDLAESSGIDVKRVTVVTWVAGGALAGLSGVLFGIAESVRWNMGNDVLLLLFAAVILGGLGTAYGAMLGGLVVGVVTQVSTYWFPAELKLMFALVVLVLVLLLKPQGILGVRERFG